MLNGSKKSNDYIRKAWDEFIVHAQLTNDQIQQFERYLQLLVEWNQKINLTTITEPASIIRYHFQDSLAVAKTIDFENVKSICDVGTGAGFPGIPLKICYPHFAVTLIEVTRKKLQFLEMVIAELGLADVLLFPYDWRTFLRKTEFEIDYFFARASLKPEELIRMFKPGCFYKHTILVYWAAQLWEADIKEQVFVENEVSYVVGNKQRKLVFFRSAVNE